MPLLPSSPRLDSNDDFFIPELCHPEALLRLVLLAELLVLVLVLAEPIHGGMDGQRLALMSLFVQWVVLLSAGVMCGLRPLLAHLPTWGVGVSCCGLVIGLTLGCTALADLYALGTALDTTGGRYWRHGLISLIVSGVVLRYFYLRHLWRLRERAELRARIESLQARIRPHFLFNSLNSIASLITVNPDRAEQAVLNLSDLFRASLSHSGQVVRWADELALGRRYLEIEQLRLGARLRVVWDIQGVPEGLPIPQLTLQPLLENAILHGIQPRVEGGCIQVRGRYIKGRFRLEICNPLPPAGSAAFGKGTCQGTAILRDRVRALFGKDAKLTLLKHADCHYTRLHYSCARHMQEVGAL